MNRLGLGARLFLLSLGLLVVAALAADAYLSAALASRLTDRIRADLAVRLALVEREASRSALGLDDRAGWDALADELGGRAAARVTLIRADGVVIGDSDVALAELPGVESHLGRPEVVAALEGRVGEDTRASATVGRPLLYMARPFVQGGRLAGVARAAVSLADVDTAIAAERRLLVLGSALGLVLAAVLAWFATRSLARDARAIAGAADRMAAGDLGFRTGMRGRGELAALGRTLDHLAGSLSTTLGELRAERDLLGGILAAMSEGVLVLDAEGRVALVNPALREMLLLDAQVVGRAPLEVIRHADLQALVARALATRKPSRAEIELGGIKPRRLLVHAGPLAGPGGVVVAFADVTDVRRLESVRRDFVSNASHELRTPVTAIRSAAETLQAGAAGDPEAAPRFVDIVARNAERLHALVEDLLDLSRFEARGLRLDLEPLAPSPVVEHVLELQRDRASRRRITLRAEVPADVPPVLADRRALERVLANLVDNAIKYGPEASTVTVRGEAAGAVVKLAVVDQGPGIDAVHLPRLFERFYRVDAGRSRELGGTGLGLSIVKHLVEAMSGDLGVESAAGVGSTFWVTLPAGAEATGTAPQ